MNDYIHGYTREEQNRLVDQATLLEEVIYQGVDLSQCTHLLEVGCGVGAQTEILLRRYPHLKITAVDLEAKQLEYAQTRLAQDVSSGRVEFIQANALDLSALAGKRYDGAFLCWFLEHVPDPAGVLSEVKRYLKPQGQIWITEVNNSALFVHPYSASFLKYWFEFNDYQWSHMGHPFVGLQLGNYLRAAGFQKVHLENKNLLFDSRDADRRRDYLHLFFNILKSANDKLIVDKRISPTLINDVARDFQTCQESEHGVFYYHFIQAHAAF